eukprot:gene12178-15298_t
MRVNNAALIALFALLLLSAADVSHAKDSTPAKSKIIESAGEALLWANTGDVAAGGACKNDIKKSCKDIIVGEGKIAACLTKVHRATRLGNTAGTKLGPKCLTELTDFKIDKSSNINKDIPLATACKDDVAKFCPKVSDDKSPGSVVACLRATKSKLTTPACKAEVFRNQIESIEDYRTDYKLNAACSDDIANLCSDVEPGMTRELQCLALKRIQVSWECQDEMFKNAKVSDDDIRLHVRLFSKCNADYKRFCKDIEPGAMRGQECLEDNLEESSFSEDCKEELEATIAARVADFRLDAGLRAACEGEFESLCGITLEQMDDDKTVKERGLTCIQQFRDEIKEDKCREEVHRRLERESRDIRFDDVLAKACADDRAEYCSDVSADHRSTLQPTCAAALFDHEVKLAEDIDFKYPMKKACGWEITNFCKDIPDGHARVVRCSEENLDEMDMSNECKAEVMKGDWCLEENLDEMDMSKECKAEVTKDMNRMATDYRLNYRLKSACNDDIATLCPNPCSTTPGQSCGGLVLQCLQEQQDNITQEACQKEVFFYELMEVTDFRNDVMLAQACRSDVETYCSDVEPEAYWSDVEASCSDVEPGAVCTRPGSGSSCSVP